MTNPPDFTEDACLRWMNKQLAKASPPLTISVLTEPNVCNGVAIGLLLETMGHIKLNGLLLQPETRVELLHNVHELFALLRQINVRLGAIQPENVMNGDKEAIMQLVQAISSHFMRQPRARRSASPYPSSQNGNRAAVHFNGISSGSVIIPRYVGSKQYEPSKMQLDTNSLGGLTNGSLQARPSLGSVALHEDRRGKSSKAMTVLFSGRSAESSMRWSVVSREHSEQNGLAVLTNGKVPMMESSSSSRCGDSNPINTTCLAQSNSRTYFAPPDYVESMKELSELRTQLNAISKLIASDNATPPADMQPPNFPARGVQTDSYQDMSSSVEMQQAQEKIEELTRILNEKDLALRQTEKENSRLNELLRSAQHSTFNSGASSNFSSSESRDVHSSCSSSILPKPQRRRTAMHVFPLDTHNRDCHVSLVDYCRREPTPTYAESRERTWDFPHMPAHHMPDLTTN